MQSDRARRFELPFFMGMGLVGFFAVFVGFGKTLPSTIADLATPPIIYIHGAFAFAWVCLFFVQASLIRYHGYRLHTALGILGIFIAAGVAITMLPVGVYQVQRQLSKGIGEGSYATIAGVMTTAIMFLALVVAAVLTRKTPAAHKRLMLLATIVVLWPAWFRFRHYFPSVPRPDIWFALVLPYIFIIIAWIWDRYANGRLHPVLGWVGAFVIVEQTFEVIVFDSPGWRMLAKAIFGFLAK